MSVSQGNIGAGPGFFPLAANPGERKARGIADAGMAVKPFFGPNPTSPVWQAGMKRDHVITAVGGDSPNVAGRAFLVWFRRHYEPGDSVTFTVVDGKGEASKVTCKLQGREE